MCSKLTAKRPERSHHFMTFSLRLLILVSLMLTLNIFHIFKNMKYAKIWTLYWKKRKKSNKLNRFKIEVCFLPNIRFWRHGYYYYQILKSQYRNHLKNKYMDFAILLDIYCINCLRKWKAPLNGILALISK